MNKKFVGIISGALMAGFALVGPTFAAEINVNDVKVETVEQPFIQDQRTMVPFRAIFEALNCDVHWYGAINTVAAESREEPKTLRLVIGQKKITVNDEDHPLDVAPVIKNSHTFIPVRAISEALGYDVKWDAKNEIVSISSPNKKEKEPVKTDVKKPVNKPNHDVEIEKYDGDAKKDLEERKDILKDDVKTIKDTVREEVKDRIHSVVAAHAGALTPEMKSALEKKLQLIQNQINDAYKAKRDLKDKRSLLHADFLKEYAEDRDAFRAYLQSGAPLLSVSASNFDLDIEDKREDYLEKKHLLDAALKDLEGKIRLLDNARAEIQKNLYR